MVRVIVIVEGGLVQSIYSDNPDELSINVVDYDEVNDPDCSKKYREKAEALKKEIEDKNMSVVY